MIASSPETDRQTAAQCLAGGRGDSPEQRPVSVWRTPGSAKQREALDE